MEKDVYQFLPPLKRWASLVMSSVIEALKEAEAILKEKKKEIKID